MYTFRQYVQEIFNTSYAFDKNDKHPKSSDQNHYYKFKDHKGKDFDVHISHSAPGMGDVTFSTGTGAGKFRATGKQGTSSPRVLSTVKSVMKHHAKRHGIDTYTFTADKEDKSRHKLYDRIASRYGGDGDTDFSGHKHYQVPVGKKFMED